MAAVEGRAKELLDAPNYATVSTLRRDGSVHTVVVWVDTEGGNAVLNSSEGRVWPRHLERDPRVTINVYDASNPYEYVEVRGRVGEAVRGEEADRNINQLAKKYMNVDEYPYRQPGEVRIKYVIAPDKVRLVAQ
jgi:PPOX class probable F420-dependent enzyme